MHRKSVVRIASAIKYMGHSRNSLSVDGNRNRRHLQRPQYWRIWPLTGYLAHIRRRLSGSANGDLSILASSLDLREGVPRISHLPLLTNSYTLFLFHCWNPQLIYKSHFVHRKGNFITGNVFFQFLIEIDVVIFNR